MSMENGSVPMERFHKLCNKIMAYNIANIFDPKKILLEAYQKEKK